MKITLIILGAIAFAVILLCIFAPTDFKLERDITINKPRNIVFAEIKFLKNHAKWNAWLKKDPSAKMEYKGTDGTVGFISSWESENQELGIGEQEIITITEGERLEMQLRFKKPMEGKLASYITTESLGENQTKVTVGMYDKMPIPMNAIHLLVDTCFEIQKKMTDNMDAGLNDLKVILEK